jgi:hypothetical protein
MADNQRNTDTVFVFSLHDMALHEAIVPNQEHVTRLAKWICENDCRTPHEASRMRVTQREQMGFCVECGSAAAWMLMQCPYIDMERDKPQQGPAAA